MRTNVHCYTEAEGKRRIDEILLKYPPNWACKFDALVDTHILLCCFWVLAGALVGILLKGPDAIEALLSPSAMAIFQNVLQPAVMGCIVALVPYYPINASRRHTFMTRGESVTELMFLANLLEKPPREVTSAFYQDGAIWRRERKIADLTWYGPSANGPWNIRIEEYAQT